MIARVDIRGDEPRALGIGPRADDRRHAGHIRREARRIEVADMRLRRDEDLAAEVPALLLGRQLILVMHPRHAGGDIGLHDFETVERPAEARFGIGDDRREPVAADVPLHMLDLVGAGERRVDPLGQFRSSVRRIERLVGIHLPGGVGIGRDLPARQIDRLQPGAHHLHRLIARQRAQRMDIVFAVEQLPQPVRPPPGQRMLDVHRPAQPCDVGRGVGPLDPVETAGRGGDQVGEVHGSSPLRFVLVLTAI